MGKKIIIDAPLVWIDLEMTGLNVDQDVILEIAIVLTDSQLSVIAEGPHLILQQPQEALDAMIDEVAVMHKQSGLVFEVLNSTMSVAQAEQQIIKFLKQHCKKGESPLCGNSVWQDKFFLQKYMPEVVKLLNYRIIDVSTVKQLVQRWYPENAHKQFEKKETHRALEDIYESIAELAWYRNYFFKD